MKRVLLLIYLTLVGCGHLSAQTVDLAGSYYHFSLAKMHELHEEYGEAISEFEQAISLDPQSAALRVDFAETLWKAGEIRRAVETCQQASELDPQSSASHFLLGRIYSSSRGGDQANMLDRAIDEFRRAIELEPDHFEALYDLGRLLLAKEDYRETTQVMDRFIRLRPWIVQAYTLKARAHLELDEVGEAIASLEQSLTYDETYIENLKLLGELYQRTGQPEKAQQLYRRTLDKRTDRDIQFRMALLLMDQDRPSEAVSILRDLAQHYPRNLQVRIALARALREHKKYGEAAEVLKGALQQNPDHYGLNYQLAEVEALLGEPQQAIERFLRLRDMSDSDEQIGAIETNLALLYQRNRRFDEAIELFRKTVLENSEDELAALRLVYALKEAGQLQEALTLSEQLLHKYTDKTYEEQPNKTYLVIARAQVLSAANQLEKAASLLKDEINRRSDPEEFYLAASQLYVDHKKYQEAEKIIQRGMSQYPESERIQFQLGAIYEQQKEWERVEAVFKNILDKNPQHAGVLNYLGYMLADRDVRLFEALDYIKRAVEIEPHNGAFLDSLGWAYFRLSQFDQAETNLLEAVHLIDSDPTIYEHLGDLYNVLGQYEKARTYFEQSILFAEGEEVHKVREKLSRLERRLSRKDH